MSDKSFRDIRRASLANYRDLFCLKVISTALEAVRIFRGDILIIAPVDAWNEEDLFVWQTPAGRVARFAFDNFGDITLHNKNGQMHRWSAHRIKCLGLVVRIERDL